MRVLLSLLAAGLLLVACAKPPVEPASTPPSTTAPPAEPAAPSAEAAAPSAEENVPAPSDEKAAAGDQGDLKQKLGLDPYPGAEVKVTNEASAGGTKTYMVQLVTADSVQKVHDFYKKSLGEPLLTDMVSGSGDSQQAVLIKADGAIQYSIHIGIEDGKTVATLARVEPQGK